MIHFKNFLLAAALALPMAGRAAEPAGYYAPCEGLNGSELLKALESVIGNHQVVGYNGLWDLYAETDAYPDGKIWDMYSTKRWTFQKEQCGTYKAVGDCYNREHSFPKSWFDNTAPMNSDAFHVYPTDGKVNGQRGNLPYGECANGSSVASSGSVRALGKVGACTFPGYSGTVFEPDDEYKGDFARSYFYMAACYNNLIDDWHSDMLAGNSYPAFQAWAVNLLMKWHRQDPVSDKEIARNEAVYGRQLNRNPFIDHPELAEYVWGDKKTQNWSSSGEAEPAIALPVDGAVYDFGYITVGGEKTLAIPVKGVNLKAPVALSTTADWFTVDCSQVAAAAACSSTGTTVVVTWDAEEAGSHRADLTFASGTARSTVTLCGVAIDGIAAHNPLEVDARSFVASWTYVGDDMAGGKYEVHCQAQGGAEVVALVDASAGQARVEGLEPSTSYVYYVKTQTMESNRVAFATPSPMASIQLYYDGDLFLEGEPGEPSQAYELLVDADNIEGGISIAVSEPFELSSDKGSWATSLAISAEEDRFYLRVNAERAGAYSTIIRLQAGDYVNDDIEVSALVSEGKGFFEDFEADADGCDTYGGCEYYGTACTWRLANAGIWEQDGSDALSGKQCVRMGKNNNSCVEMLGDKPRGLGVAKMWAKRWTANEGDCQFVVEYSADHGGTWQRTAQASVESDEYQEFTFTINVPGECRLRVQQTAGKRFIIDDISISDYEEAGVGDAEDGSRSWDAFCRGGKLVIEMGRPQACRVYGVDGIVYFDGVVEAGFKELSLPKGLYVVAVDGFGRRVLVK